MMGALGTLGAGFGRLGAAVWRGVRELLGIVDRDENAVIDRDGNSVRGR